MSEVIDARIQLPCNIMGPREREKLHFYTIY